MNRGLDDQLQAYSQRHRNEGVLLDANVLLLLWLSAFDPSLVGGKRLEKYSLDDAALLQSFVRQFSRVLTTHTVLAETSNLAASVLSGQRKRALFERLYPFFGTHPPDAFGHCAIGDLPLPADVFVPLGFTDATLMALITQPDSRLLLTDDLDLYVAAVARGAHALNFTHMREAAGFF